MKAPAIAVALAILTSAPVGAQQSVELQWQGSPRLTMRELVDKGFEIKGVVTSRQGDGTGAIDSILYVLQRGSEVYRCREAANFDADGRIQAQSLLCSALVAPFDPHATAAG